MAIRKSKARTEKDIMSENYNEVLEKGKKKFRYEKEFYVGLAYKGSDYYMTCRTSSFEFPKDRELKFEHWIFNEEIKRWECNS